MFDSAKLLAMKQIQLICFGRNFIRSKAVDQVDEIYDWETTAEVRFEIELFLE